jgi:hypothetical protein
METLEWVMRLPKDSSMKSTLLFSLFGWLLLFADAPRTTAWANDTAAELSIGGLTFRKTDSISIESEELTITLDTVTVRYQFLNQSPNPVTLTVAFPLPDIDVSDGANYAIPQADSVNFVKFETKVDGKPIDFTIHQRALLGNKDVTAQLKDLGIPPLPFDNLPALIKPLPDATRKQMLDQGLLVQAGSNDRGQPLYDAGWRVSTSAVREQTFPPNRVVLVEHRYRTSLGISFDSIMRKAMRQKTGLAKETQRYRRDYCISDGFLVDLDKIAGGTQNNTSKIEERRISYVLKTGANWATPIKQFRLLVDTGRAGRLASFCAPNIAKRSPTEFEARAENFTPTSDLKILVIGQF